MTAEFPAAVRRFPIGLTVATVVALAMLVGLGSWQVQRLAWKQALLARIETLKAASPVPIGPVLSRLVADQDVDLTRVSVTCIGLVHAPTLELFSVRDTGAGVRLISACALPGPDFRSILVDRGFVQDVVKDRPAVDANDTSPVQLVGVLRKPDRATFVTPPNEVAANHWYSRDVPAMARTLGAQAPAPIMLMAETQTAPDFPALMPAPLPSEISNRHLEYALTWFGLAVALAGVYAASLWKIWKV